MPFLDGDVLRIGRTGETAEGFEPVDLGDTGRTERVIRDFQPEMAIHLAWSDLPDYSVQACSKNVRQSVGLVDALVRNGCRKIFVAGSCWEYDQDFEGPVSEETAVTHMNLFGAAKTAIRVMLESICWEAGSTLVWGRIFYAYGPGQRETSLIPTVVRSVLAAQDPPLRNAAAANDFVHVQDVGKAIALLMKADAAAGIYNIGSGTLTRVDRIVRLVRSIVDERRYPAPAAENDLRGFFADVARLNDLGWRPDITLEDGLLELAGRRGE